MKKFFAIAFIAATLVACGGGETPPADAGTSTGTTTGGESTPAGTSTETTGGEATPAGTATPTTPQP